MGVVLGLEEIIIYVFHILSYLYEGAKAINRRIGQRNKQGSGIWAKFNREQGSENFKGKGDSSTI